MKEIDAAIETDWKGIAMKLGQRVNWAISYLDCKGSGVIGNLEKPSSEWQHWRDYMADALEEIPDVKVDREIMHTLNLPKAKQKKAQEQIKAARAAAKEQLK